MKKIKPVKFPTQLKVGGVLEFDGGWYRITAVFDCGIRTEITIVPTRKPKKGKP